MPLTLIAAVNRLGVIGREGGLPWRDSQELAHFRRETAGKTLVMGRKTFESLPALSSFRDRRFMVVTRDASYSLPPEVGGVVVDDPQACLSLEEEVMVAGGQQVYSQLMPHADRMVISRMPNEVEGDAYFPAYTRDEWGLLYRVNKPTFQVDVLRRR